MGFRDSGIPGIPRESWESRESHGNPTGIPGIPRESRESRESHGNPGNPMGIPGIPWESRESRESWESWESGIRRFPLGYISQRKAKNLLYLLILDC